MARTKSVLLRLTEEEHARLKELAGREPVAAYLRRMAGLEAGDWKQTGDERDRRAAGVGDFQPTYRCPVHAETTAKSPKGRCFCNRFTTQSL